MTSATVRVTLEQRNERDAETPDRVIGALVIGTPDDEASTFVSSGRHVLLRVTHPADGHLQGVFGPGDDADVLRLAAARRFLVERAMIDVRAWIASGGTHELPAAVALTADEAVRFTRRAALKECAFQARTAPGLVCLATDDGMADVTSVPLCEHCSLPDDRIRCTALAHPTISTHRFQGGISKSANQALCDGGHQDHVGDFSQCRVGGNPCWRQDLAIIDATANPVPDSPARLIDEYGHLRLALAAAGIEPTRGSGELELGATIARDCDTQDEFSTRVQAVASLLDLLGARSYVAAQNIDLGGRQGSLISLTAALDHLHVDGHTEPIALLRAVPAIRQLVPAHPIFTDAALRFSQFGIETPITDWRVAWLTFADRVREALRAVRLAVEARPEPEDAAGR